jgi:hypothetical protein
MTQDISDQSPTTVSSASHRRSSPSRHDIFRTFSLVVCAVIIGAAAWSGEVLALPLAVGLPALWALAPSRISAAAVAAGYFLAASRGLPQGVMNFYGSALEAGIALWLGASLSFVIVHAVLWTSRSGWRRALRYGAAAVLMCVPPFGIVGWSHTDLPSLLMVEHHANSSKAATNDLTKNDVLPSHKFRLSPFAQPIPATPSAGARLSGLRDCAIRRVLPGC